MHYIFLPQVPLRILNSQVCAKCNNNIITRMYSNFSFITLCVVGDGQGRRNVKDVPRGRKQQLQRPQASISGHETQCILSRRAAQHLRKYRKPRVQSLTLTLSTKRPEAPTVGIHADVLRTREMCSRSTEFRSSGTRPSVPECAEPCLP